MVGFCGRFGDDESRGKCGCGEMGDSRRIFEQESRWGGELLNPLNERFRGGDEGLGDVGGILRQILRLVHTEKFFRSLIKST